MADPINVLNNTTPPVVDKPKEQIRINVSNIPPKSIGERELDDTVLTETSTNIVTNKIFTSLVINTGISGTGIATGAEVTTGTDDTQIVTPKAIGDAGVNTRLKSKIITVTRDLTAGTGSVAYTGAGFQPTSLQGFGNLSGGAAISWGMVDSALNQQCVIRDTDTGHYSFAIFLKASTAAGVDFQTFTITAFGADGFTGTWTKTGTPTGTINFYVTCFR